MCFGMQYFNNMGLSFNVWRKRFRYSDKDDFAFLYGNMRNSGTRKTDTPQPIYIKFYKFHNATTSLERTNNV
jgi:hypothetical protein